MKKYKRGTSYLTRVGGFKANGISTFRCELCLSLSEFKNYSVNTGHTKTCGCMNGKKNNKTSCLNEDGTITSVGGYDLTSKVANGYRGFEGQYVHRLIATRFLKNPDNLTDVNHINGIKTDNRVANLEWCSRSYNLKHAIRTGLKTYKKGGVSTNRKLTDTQVAEILEAEGSGISIGKLYGVSKTVIYKIRKNNGY